MDTKLTFYLTKVLSCVLTVISLTLHMCCYSQKSITDTIIVQSQPRVFKHTVPVLNNNNPNIILLLHGSGMNAKFMEEVVGVEFLKQSRKHKESILVYPEGFKGNWNDCRKYASYPAKKDNIDDIQFILDIISTLKKKYSIKNPRVFAAGYSNGGHMCFKLAKLYPETFDGFAVVGANLPVNSNDDCQSSNKPVSILIVNGTSDPVNPYMGGAVVAKDGNTRGSVLSTDDTLKYWLDLIKGRRLKITETKFPNIISSDSSTAQQITYTCADTNKKVSLVKVINGGHHFNNPAFHQWPEYLGNPNQDINLPEIILSFFND